MLQVRFMWRLVAAAMVLSLGACAGTPMSDRLSAHPPDGLPNSVELEETPFYPQTRYYCGPATMAALLRDTGIDTDPQRIADQLFTPGRKGTLQSDVIASARRNGRLAVRVDGMQAAFREVAAGRPILILQNLGLEMAPQWHYAILIGFELDRKEAILRSGTTRRKRMPLETLEHTWRRGGFWGVAVVQPEGPVPVTANPVDWLKEASGLERANQRDAARTAYATAVAHWPSRSASWFALGNFHYTSGDLAASEDALREAAARAPDDGAALNNLAHVLMERGKLDEAEAAAMKAVEAGGNHRAAAERTLAEIRERRREA